jgi:pimeloyl-ACP methyl ester carboxylesterase
MRTASGVTYEIMHGGDQVIVACTCWTDVTPVIANLDTHWLRRLAQEHTLVLISHRGLAGSTGRADLASEILGLREVVDEVGTPVILLGGCEATVVPIALAARQPDRVRALIVVNGTARFVADADYAGRPVGGLWLDTTPLRGDWEGYFVAFYPRWRRCHGPIWTRCLGSPAPVSRARYWPTFSQDSLWTCART